MSGKTLKKQITIWTKFRPRLAHSSIQWDIHCKPYLALYDLIRSSFHPVQWILNRICNWGLIGRLLLTKCRSYSNISMIRNRVRLSCNKSFCYKDSSTHQTDNLKASSFRFFFLCPRDRRTGAYSFFPFYYSLILPETWTLRTPFKPWVLELWFFTWVFLVKRPFRMYQHMWPHDLRVLPTFWKP